VCLRVRGLPRGGQGRPFEKEHRGGRWRRGDRENANSWRRTMLSIIFYGSFWGGGDNAKRWGGNPSWTEGTSTHGYTETEKKSTETVARLKKERAH